MPISFSRAAFLGERRGETRGLALSYLNRSSERRADQKADRVLRGVR
jgi:hypothetical protein